MKLFDRLRRGWSIGISALGVACREPKLFLLAALPLLALITLIGLAVYGPFVKYYVKLSVTALVALMDGLPDGDEFTPDQFSERVFALVYAYRYLFYALGLLGYLLIWFVMVFFNTVLVAATLDYFEHGKVSLRNAFALAFRRLPQILAWSLFAATVGLLLSFISSMIKGALESVSALLGNFLGGLLEASWVVATYFVAPVLIIEGVGPVAATRRSVQVLRQAWGESLGSGFGLGLLWLVLFIVPITLLFGLPAIGAWPPNAVGMAWSLGLLYAVVTGVLISVVAAVQCSALFLFAVTGRPPSGFDGSTMAGAFQRR